MPRAWLCGDRCRRLLNGMQTSQDATCRLRGCKNSPEEGKKHCRTCLDAEAARKREAREKNTALTENNTQQTGSRLALGTKSSLNGQQRDIEARSRKSQLRNASISGRYDTAYLVYKERGSPSRSPSRSKLLITSLAS